MHRNEVRLTDKPSSQDVLQRTGWAVVAWGAVLVLVALVWVDGQNGVSALGGLGVLLALLALALERGLGLSGLQHSRRYRLAFLLSIILPIAITLMQWVGSILHLFVVQREITLTGEMLRFAVAAIGAFSGILLATALNEGLWENNSPPSEAVRLEVEELHRALIGAPGKQPWAKRSFDVLVALFGLVFSAPLWMLSIFLIWIEDPGPVLFVKNSVGKGGVNFQQFKLRTMVHGAEENTGPVLAQQGDQRVLLFGRLLRKTALDELPQLINILTGQMSFVGPRPQRTVLVREYLQRMPEYAERHRVLPGIAGLAQVAGDYYLTPRQKLRFDRLYIRYSSLGFDLKLLGLAFLITFWLRWKKDWDGRLPRKLIRWGRKN